MTLKEAKKKGVTFNYSIEPDFVDPRGNVSASGDEEADKAAEREVFQRLKQGEWWAWCCIIVEAAFRGFKGSDALGACSYEGVREFESTTYPGMCKLALQDLERVLKAQVAMGETAGRALAELTKT